MSGKIKAIVYLLVVFIIGLTLRLFFIGIYMVASGSMEQTMYKGDVVLVNKFAYGARLSQEQGDLPLLLWMNNWLGIEKATIHTRMPKLGDIHYGDIVVFNQPFKKDKFVKRCTGLPGDTFQISHNVRYIDGKSQKEPETVRYSYKLTVDNGILPVDTLKKYGVNTYGHLWREGNEEHYTLSKTEVEKLGKCTIIQNIEMDDYPQGAPGPRLFPSKKFAYTRENFGPFIIPAKGLTLSLDSANIDYYRDVIVHHEHNSLKLKGGLIFINNNMVTQYTFKQDYFFMMGDNRYQSYDSRYWGFVPETDIIGKVSCVLF